MYEQNRVSVVGRVLWFLVSLLILAALVWLVLWLLFWRSPKVDKAANTAVGTTQNVVQSGSSAIEKAIDTPTNKQSTDTTSSSAATSGTGTTQTSTQTQTPTSSTSATESVATSTSATSKTTTGQTSSTATQTPSTTTELANTGAGDVLLPVAAAILGASAYYHVRLRRKVSL